VTCTPVAQRPVKNGYFGVKSPLLKFLRTINGRCENRWMHCRTPQDTAGPTTGLWY